MDREQLAAAMEAHGDMVYRLALCRLRNPADAEDVYQAAVQVAAVAER